MTALEKEFDDLFTYTLRVELENGKVLLYLVDSENKNFILDKLRLNADGNFEIRTISFLWFETSGNRTVLLNTDFILRVTFCFDDTASLGNPNIYYDNFGMLEKETILKEHKTDDGEVQLHIIEEHYLPQAIILHRGKAPDDHYDGNPLTYSELAEGCLAWLELELEGEIPFRQFINLIDNDGEETFIPVKQIIVMEIDSNLLNVIEEGDYPEDDNNIDFE